jgi:hypothetical protein
MGHKKGVAMKLRRGDAVRSMEGVKAGTPALKTRLGRVAGARKRADFVETMAGPVARFRRSRKLR